MWNPIIIYLSISNIMGVWGGQSNKDVLNGIEESALVTWPWRPWDSPSGRGPGRGGPTPASTSGTGRTCGPVTGRTAMSYLIYWPLILVIIIKLIFRRVNTSALRPSYCIQPGWATRTEISSERTAGQPRRPWSTSWRCWTAPGRRWEKWFRSSSPLRWLSQTLRKYYFH